MAMVSLNQGVVGPLTWVVFAETSFLGNKKVGGSDCVIVVEGKISCCSLLRPPIVFFV